MLFKLCVIKSRISKKSGNKTISNIVIWIARHFFKTKQAKSFNSLAIFYVSYILAFIFLRLTGLKYTIEQEQKKNILQQLKELKFKIN